MTFRSSSLSVLWALLLTGALATQSPPARANCTAIGLIGDPIITFLPDHVVNGVDYGQICPTLIMVQVNAQYLYPTGTDLPLPRLRVVFVDCDCHDNQANCPNVAVQVPAAHTDSFIAFTDTILYSVPSCRPFKLVVEDCLMLGGAWTAIKEYDVRPILPCPLDPDELANVCGPPSGMPSENFRFYKSTNTLYAARLRDPLDLSVGEAVNGEFIAPESGKLIVCVEERAGAASVRGSTTEGWVVDGKRHGSYVGTVPRCIALDQSGKYMFNVQAGTTDAYQTLKLRFDWVSFNEETCELMHWQKRLELSIEPMRVEPSDDDPVKPRVICVHTLSDGTKNYEIRIPKCPWRGGHPAGNLSGKFVAWPTADELVIDRGFAKGYVIADLEGKGLRAPGSRGEVTLTEPGPDGRKFIFGH